MMIGDGAEMYLFQKHLKMTPFEDDELASSDQEDYDSDRIESDIEAELYSIVHHEADTSVVISDVSNSSPPNENINSNETILHSSELEKSLSNSSKNKESEISDKYFNTYASITNSVNNNFFVDKIRSNSTNFAIESNIYTSDLYTSFESPKHEWSALKNISTKRKSEITEHSNAIPSQNKKQKKFNSKIKTLEKTVDNDFNRDNVSSDNESDIICLGLSNDQNSLQTNLSQNVIHISSDSTKSDSDSDTWCYTTSNTSVYNLNQSKIKEPWFINDEDKYRSRRNSGRYHESKLLNCNICYQKGHLAKFCPNFKVHKCFLCGDRHKPSQCKNRICGKCHKIGHDGRYCQRKIIYCLHCRMPGHYEHACPDIWRRYHLTTTKKFIKPKKYKDTGPLYCYNCGYLGHFGGVCMERRMIMKTFPTWPCVINFKAIKKDQRQKFTSGNEKKSNKMIDKNPSSQKPVSFIDQFLKDKEQAILENRIRRKEKRMEKKKLKKLNKALLKNDNTQEEKANLLPKTPEKNQNVSQESEAGENSSQKTETTLNEMQNFPRTPKKNLNLSQESEASESQNQSAKKTLNKKDRKARNMRRKFKKKVNKMNTKQSIIDQEINNKSGVVKKKFKRTVDQERKVRPVIIKLQSNKHVII